MVKVFIYASTILSGAIAGGLITQMIEDIYNPGSGSFIDYALGKGGILAVFSFAIFYGVRWAVRYVQRIENENKELQENIMQRYREEIERLRNEKNHH